MSRRAVPCPSELSRRANGVKLTASSSTKVLVLHGEAAEGAWRIVEVQSDKRLPFQVFLAWTAGDGGEMVANVTVAAGTRIGLFARSLRIQAANLADLDHYVTAVVPDGFLLSQNQWEEVGSLDGSAVSFTIPTYATRFRFECEDQAQLAAFTINVADGVTDIRSEHLGSTQPDGGIPIGGARTVIVGGPNNVRFRLVFFLSI